MSDAPLLGLGIDAGGTHTRWALAGTSGDIVAEGEVGGMSAIGIGGEGAARGVLAELAAAARAHGRPTRVHAGLTGFGERTATLVQSIAAPLGIAADAVTLGSDIEIAYLDLFAPGEGYVVYAGTGSIAAFIDAAGALHCAGGRGVILDDGGGGFWIAREALRRVWRTEDERPGSAKDSALAQALFAQIGGSDWAHSRAYVYGRDRGEVGRLALAVASAAETDSDARDILEAAGRELARLAQAMSQRYGPRAVALTGRAAQLHPRILESMRSTLPRDTPLALRVSRGHHAAARLALQAALRR